MISQAGLRSFKFASVNRCGTVMCASCLSFTENHDEHICKLCLSDSSFCAVFLNSHDFSYTTHMCTYSFLCIYTMCRFHALGVCAFKSWRVVHVQRVSRVVETDRETRRQNSGW